jgi:hypothetical protein
MVAATPLAHVRTVPSPATVTAHDVSDAKAAATTGTEAVIDMKYHILPLPSVSGSGETPGTTVTGGT